MLDYLKLRWFGQIQPRQKSVNKHMSKRGLREIIKQERTIEMAFEGHRYNDLRRWKKEPIKY